ncbi:MAG TPA: hypothetical protein EYQ75_08100 [Planctomycetaceae bacterium]|nr:hypothetical protein [Planctomycetaceae bacterium]
MLHKKELFMTTKPASSRWIAIFSGIVLLVLCFLAAETWHSRQLHRTMEVDPGAFEANDVGHYPSQSNVSVKETTCENPDDWKIDGLEALAVPESWAVVAPAAADRIEIRVPAHDGPLRPMGQTSSLADGRPLRIASLRRQDPQVPSLPRNVTRSLNTPSAKNNLRQWPYPEQLVRQLEALTDDAHAGSWATRTIGLINRLYDCDDDDHRLCLYFLAELRQQVERAIVLVDPTASLESWSKVARARYALHRRVELWQLVQELKAGDIVWVTGDEKQLRLALDNIDRELTNSTEIAAWKTYLLFSQIKMLWNGELVNADHRRLAARRVLERLADPSLNADQRAFLERPPFQSLAYQLRGWASEPIDYNELLTVTEACEVDATQANGRKLTEAIQKLRWSNNSVAERLAEHLEHYYRNANVRVSVSAELLRRLLPVDGPERRRVQDRILGTPVVGSSINQRDLYIKLVPHDQFLQIAMVARGIVDSKTYSDVGPVRIHNNGQVRFQAAQLVVLDHGGFRIPDPDAQAQGRSSLTGVETDFDIVPLLGTLVRSFASQQHDVHYDEANSEMEAKVARRAACELHQTIKRGIDDAETRIQQRLVTPLKKLRLNPVAMNLQTTDRRIVARYRLAGEDQLAAHTPRPLAPSESWLSVQLHESSVNNALARLGLERRRVTVEELYRKIMSALSIPGELPEDLPRDVYVTFDENEPIRVVLGEGRILLQMRISELESPNNLWNDFIVSTSYVAAIEGRLPVLKRDSLIDLDGDFSLFERIPLRAIFNAVLPKNKAVALVGSAIRDDPRFSDTFVSQFTLVDGWMGIAVGGNRRPRQAIEPGLGSFIR